VKVPSSYVTYEAGDSSEDLFCELGLKERRDDTDIERSDNLNRTLRQPGRTPGAPSL